MNKPFFVHFVLELKAASTTQNEENALLDKINGWLTQLNLVVVNECEHRFTPIGLSKVFILSTSHLALHTWPENTFAHIDLVCCDKNVTLDKVKDASNAFFGDSLLSLKQI